MAGLQKTVGSLVPKTGSVGTPVDTQPSLDPLHPPLSLDASRPQPSAQVAFQQLPQYLERPAAPGAFYGTQGYSGYQVAHQVKSQAEYRRLLPSPQLDALRTQAVPEVLNPTTNLNQQERQEGPVSQPVAETDVKCQGGTRTQQQAQTPADEQGALLTFDALWDAWDTAVSDPRMNPQAGVASRPIPEMTPTPPNPPSHAGTCAGREGTDRSMPDWFPDQ